MKDPTRLLDASASEIELHLLRAGAAEQPPSAAVQRLAEQLGVSVRSADIEHAAGAAPAKLPLVAANKGLLAIGLATVATIAAVGWIAARGEVFTGDKGDARSPASTRTLPTPAVDPTSGRDKAATRAQDTDDHQPAATLALEIARIDAARRELAANRGRPAITLLQGYQRDFPSGVLRQEAELLNIEAHRHAGDRRRARTLASRFLTNNPDSPHSARVRELLEALGPDAH